MTSMRYVTFTGPAAVCTVADGQAIGRWQGHSAKLLLLALPTALRRKRICPWETPVASPLAQAQRKQSSAAPGRALHHIGKGSRYAHNVDS